MLMIRGRFRKPRIEQRVTIVVPAQGGKTKEQLGYFEL
jgi:hypothetical protein